VTFQCVRDSLGERIERFFSSHPFPNLRELEYWASYGIARVMTPRTVSDDGRKLSGRALRNFAKRGVIAYVAISILSAGWLTVTVHAAPVASGTVPFVLEDNRVYVKLPFVMPNGSLRKAWTFVDIGTPDPTVSSALYRDLNVAEAKAAHLRLGDLAVEIPAQELVKSDWFYGFRKSTEFILPGSVMQRFEVAIDYSKRTLTFAAPGALGREGVAVPCRVNHKTGLIAVAISVDGRSYQAAVDNGSAYTWFDDETAQEWIRVHPQWQRGVGAVGEANMQMMSDSSFLLLKLPSAVGLQTASLQLSHSAPDREASGIILRLPEIKVGSLQLHEVGALAVGDVFEWYSRKTPVPVVGWLGGNILRNFRVTIDFANQMTYWLRQSDLNPHDLNQVGLTLLALGDNYLVAGMASQDGVLTVTGISPGDRLMKINAMKVTGASRDAVLSALHGKPGDMRAITVDRDGKEVTVQAQVKQF
jgi:hypothetical protein